MITETQKSRKICFTDTRKKINLTNKKILKAIIIQKNHFHLVLVKADQNRRLQASLADHIHRDEFDKTIHKIDRIDRIARIIKTAIIQDIAQIQVNTPIIIDINQTQMIKIDTTGMNNQEILQMTTIKFHQVAVKEVIQRFLVELSLIYIYFFETEELKTFPNNHKFN